MEINNYLSFFRFCEKWSIVFRIYRVKTVLNFFQNRKQISFLSVVTASECSVSETDNLNDGHDGHDGHDGYDGHDGHDGHDKRI